MTTACQSCDKTFKSEKSLQQHLQDSPRHKGNHYCEPCDRYFDRAESLQQHLDTSKAHSEVAGPAVRCTTDNTPLDRFFRSFPSFAYDPLLPPATSYSLLRRHMASPRHSREGMEALEGYREALVAEVRVWFGSEDDLTSWHTLCRAIGVQQPPDTIDGCKTVRFLMAT